MGKTRHLVVSRRVFQVAALLVVALAALIPLVRFGGWEIDHTDVGLIRGPWHLASTLSGPWNQNQFGFNQTNSRALLVPVDVVFGLMQLAHVPAGDRTQLWLTLLLFAAGAGMWWFLRGFVERAPLNDAIVVISSVAFMFSSYVILLATDNVFGFIVPYATLPWLFGVAYRSAHKKIRPLRATGLLALLVFATTALDPPLLVIDIAATLLFGVAVAPRGRRLAQMSVLCSGLFLGLVTLIWVLAPLAWSTHVDPNQALTSLAKENIQMYDQQTTPANVTKLQGYWALYSGYAGRPYRPYQSYYLSSPFGNLSGLVLVGLAVMGAFISRTKRLVPVLLVVGLVAWRAVVGVNASGIPPGSDRLVRWLYTNVPLGGTFRDTFKFMPVLILVVVTLAAAGLTSRTDVAKSRAKSRTVVRWLGVGLFGLCTIAIAEPIWGGQIWWPDTGTQLMPHYWQAAADWINSRPGPASQRVLLLPDMPFPVYSWGSPPNDPSSALFEHWQVYEMSSEPTQYVRKEVTALINTIHSVSTDQGRSLDTLLSADRIRYILVQGDMLTGYYHVTPAAAYEDWLREARGLTRVASFGPLVFFKVNEPLAPMVGCPTQACTTRVASNTGSTRFLVDVSRATSPRALQLNESYDQG